MSNLSKPAMWTFLGMGAAVMAGAYWFCRDVYLKDRKLFNEAFNEFGFPRTKDDLLKFWQRARRERIEDAKEALENKLLVEEMADFIAVSENLKKAYVNVWDLSCDAQVAVWVLKDALMEWGRVFKLTLQVDDDPELDKFLEELVVVREETFVERICKEREEHGPVPILAPLSPLLQVSDSPMQCSFCGKAKDEVKKLIAGPSVHICNECVLLCSDILVEERDS